MLRTIKGVYMLFENFKQSILEYLELARELEKQDIDTHKNLSDDEKIEKGFMIKDAVVVETIGNHVCKLSVKENYTRWRTGDSIKYVSRDKNIKGTCIVDENYNESLILTGMPHRVGETYDLYLIEGELLSIFISTIRRIEDGGIGSGFIKVFAGMQVPYKKKNRINRDLVSIPENLNELQKKAVEDILEYPQIYAIQGPPGTGKSDVLAIVAKLFSEQGKDVLVLSNTHHAVNNALNKIAKYDLPIYKIGTKLKSKELKANIKLIDSKSSKFSLKKNKGQKHGSILGMSLCGVISQNIPFTTSFTPSLILVDEASQITLAQALAIGALGAGCCVFIGDNFQMPPIFHESIKSNQMSISVFEKLTEILPSDLRTTLTTTYRMNEPICQYVSEKFYEPHNIKLESFYKHSKSCIKGETLSGAMEFVTIDTKCCKDFNREEAIYAVKRAFEYKTLGEDVAIITPFRKQLNLLREEWVKKGGNTDDILIDTVERLQGQDVDVIIITTSISDEEYYKTNLLFVENPNRWNVMISRAKKKVIVIKSPLITIKPIV